MLVPVIPNIICSAMSDPLSFVYAKFIKRAADPHNRMDAPIMGEGGVSVVGLE